MAWPAIWTLLPSLALAIGCVYASWSDLVSRRIPNWLCGSIAIVGLAAAGYRGGPVLVANHTLHLAVAMVVGIVFFATRVVGGGDVKFYSAVAAWFDFHHAIRLFVAVAACGFVLLLFWVGWRITTGKSIRNKVGDAFDSLPYGVAVAAGSILMNALNS